MQLAIPEGSEERARQFYVKVLGLAEIPKPEGLAGRGGLWLSSGSVAVHLGIDREFHPARKAHPAFICNDYAAVLERLRGAGSEPVTDNNVPGMARSHVFDPFGNRIELIAAS